MESELSDSLLLLLTIVKWFDSSASQWVHSINMIIQFFNIKGGFLSKFKWALLVSLVLHYLILSESTQAIISFLAKTLNVVRICLIAAKLLYFFFPFHSIHLLSTKSFWIMDWEELSITNLVICPFLFVVLFVFLIMMIKAYMTVISNF